jgi:hypothetical protein
MARHLVEACPLENKSGLRASRTPSLRQLLSEKGKMRGVAQWFIAMGRLRQFDLAGRLLYGE